MNKGTILEAALEAIKYTFERLTKDDDIDGRASPRKSIVGPISGSEIVVTSKARIKARINFETPWSQLPAFLTLHEIVSAKYTNALGGHKISAKPMYRSRRSLRGISVLPAIFAEQRE